jgi:hypothetical protein
MRYALSHSTLAVVQLLQREGGLTVVTQCWPGAAAGSSVESVEKLRWLRQGDHGMAYEVRDDAEDEEDEAAWLWDEAMVTAVVAGNQEAVRFLVEEVGAQLPDDLESYCARDMVSQVTRAHPDRVAVLRYLETRGVCPPPKFMLEVAVLKGDAEALLWLLTPERVQPADPAAFWEDLSSWPELRRCSAAAEVDCLRAVKLLASSGRGHPGAVGVQQAAEAGSLAIVRWLVEECGCPVGPGALQGAADSGNEALIEYLVARGAPLANLSFAGAANAGDLATLRLLVGVRVPWGKGALSSVVTPQRCGTPVPVVQWLVQRGLPLRLAEVEALVAKYQHKQHPWEQLSGGLMEWLVRTRRLLQLGLGRGA